MFSFDFDSTGMVAGSTATDASSADLRPACEHSAQSVEYLNGLDEASKWPVERVLVSGSGVELRKCVPPEVALPRLLDAERRSSKDDAIPEAHAAELATSDLVPNLYEGGFKVWECAHDLLEEMHAMVCSGELTLRHAAVLEAGCGAGLPGAFAAHLGARHVVMQDFNASVLTSVTMHTLRLSDLWTHVEAGRVRFLSGDWETVNALLLSERSATAAYVGAQRPDQGIRSDGELRGTYPALDEGFDGLLSADTIYSPSATPRLWKLLSSQLRPGGLALIAAKSYYFGVGGSVASFKALAEADGRFERWLHSVDDGSHIFSACPPSPESASLPFAQVRVPPATHP